MITFKHKGDFKNTERFFAKSQKLDVRNLLERYAKRGVDALSSATPIDTGLTASSWTYEIKTTKSGITIYWFNTNVVDNIKIALIIQYGHGTGNGAYIQGIDYINPAIRPIFDELSEALWKEVTSL